MPRALGMMPSLSNPPWSFFHVMALTRAPTIGFSNPMRLRSAKSMLRQCSHLLAAPTNRMRISEGYAAIHGLPEGTTEISHSQWRAGVHPEDLGRIETQRDEAYRERRREHTAEYRIVRRGEVRWIDARKFISY